jgi:hypothetical protein
MKAGGNTMDVLWTLLAFAGHAVGALLSYVETHHWIFGFAFGGYLFYRHDRAVHQRLDDVDKRLSEIRKRLALEY